jgi:uncharacterized protein (UPF0333 family)
MLEYTLLIAAVVAAFLSIQYYLGNSLQGKVKEAADNMGQQFDIDHTSYTFTTVKKSQSIDTTGGTGLGAGVTLSKLGNVTTDNVDTTNAAGEFTSHYGNLTISATEQ